MLQRFQKSPIREGPSLSPGRCRAFLPYLILLAAAWFGFANPVLQIPPLLLLYPAVLSHLAATSTGRRQALQRGWLAGSLSYIACLYWVAVPVHFFGPLPWILALPCPILLGIYLGLYPAIFVLFLHLAGRRFSWFRLGLFGGLAWILLEWIRSQALTGFPWLTLAQGFAPWPAAIQTVEYIGGLGLSGGIALCGIWLRAGLKDKPAWVLAAILILGTAGYGLLAQNRPEAQSGHLFQALIVQGNIEQNVKWDPEYQRQTVDSYLDLSRRGLQDFDPDLVIWPETAMPFYLQEASRLSREVKAFCRTNQVPLITGAPGYKPKPDGGFRLYNRAYLISSLGRIEGYYAKEHLVPFGEYLPLPAFLPFLHKLVQGVSDFSPGRVTTPLRTKKLALGLLICYEIIFDGLAAKRIEEKSNVLVNLSNDAWFGRTSAPRQHLHQAVLRAVEQGRYVLRATNSGISAVISPRGTIREQSPLFTTRIIQAASLRTRTERTFYSKQRTPLLAGWLILLLLISLTAARGTPSRRSHPEYGD